MEKFINRYELAVILKSVDGEEYSKLADIVKKIQETYGNIKELEGYGWWPITDQEEVWVDDNGEEMYDFDYAFQHYNELPTRIAINLIKKWYPNKFFYHLNEEALEVLEDLRARHGKKYRWRTIGKLVSNEKRRLYKFEA